MVAGRRRTRYACVLLRKVVDKTDLLSECDEISKQSFGSCLSGLLHVMLKPCSPMPPRKKVAR